MDRQYSCTVLARVPALGVSTRLPPHLLVLNPQPTKTESHSHNRQNPKKRSHLRGQAKDRASRRNGQLERVKENEAMLKLCTKLCTANKKTSSYVFFFFFV